MAQDGVSFQTFFDLLGNDVSLTKNWNKMTVNSPLPNTHIYPITAIKLKNKIKSAIISDKRKYYYNIIT